MYDLLVLSKATQTKLHILQSLNKPIDDITVGQICETAGISRQTFYSHFYSKYEIAYWYFALGYETFLANIGRTTTWDEGFLSYFNFLYEEKEPLSHAFANNPKLIDVEPRIDYLRNNIRDVLTKSKHMKIDRELEYCIDYYVKSGNRMIVEWCTAGMPDSPGDFVKYYKACAPHRLVSILSQIERHGRE